MSLDVFDRVVEFLGAQGVDDLRLTGGEPTLHPQFELMLDRLTAKKIRPRLITNGIRLMEMQSPDFMLSKMDRCWISLYGISPEQHRTTGGVRTRTLEDVLSFAATQTRAGHWVGVSAMLTEINFEAVETFMSLIKAYEIRYLRFLFAEPSGRAVATHVAFSYGNPAREDAKVLMNYLSHSVKSTAIEFLSINNPFDLGDNHEPGQASCLLSARRMWSFSPTGDIYSCCFNIYDPAHWIANIISGEGLNNLDSDSASYASCCKALDPDFWKTSDLPVTCPISAITLSLT